MSENPEFRKNESCPWFDGTLAGWAELQRQTEVFAWDGAVIALGLADAEVPKWVASGYLSTRFSKIGPDGESAFPDITTLLPPQESGHLWRESLREIRRLMRERQADELSLSLAPLIFECRSLVTLQTEDLLDEIADLPEGSCCFVLGSDLYRSSVHSSENVEQGRIFVEDIVNAELERLMRALLEIAQIRKLAIIVTCEYWRVRRSPVWAGVGDQERFLGGVFVPVPDSVTREIFETSRAAFKASAWPGVAASAEELGLPPELLASKLIQTYLDSDDARCAAVFTACAAAEEHLLSEHLVAAAQLASTGGDGGERDLLQAALAHQRVLPLEALAIGYHTARSAGLDDLSAAFRVRLLQRYPRNRVAETSTGIGFLGSVGFRRRSRLLSDSTNPF